MNGNVLSLHPLPPFPLIAGLMTNRITHKTSVLLIKRRLPRVLD
jgi:hypothetical protein